MKTILKVMLGILLACVVLIGGCAALLGAGIDEAQEESDKTAITVQEYGSVKTGATTRDEIVERFGEPQSSDSVEAEGIKGIPESDFSQNCLYYSRKGELASLFQFCVDGDGVVRSKASY